VLSNTFLAVNALFLCIPLICLYGVEKCWTMRKYLNSSPLHSVSSQEVKVESISTNLEPTHRGWWDQIW